MKLISVFSVLISIVFVAPATLAQQEGELLEVSPNDIIQASNDLDTIENDRQDELEKQLLLNLPGVTDNPNHVLTFTDPSGMGVFLNIDGQGYQAITSPYNLPSLGIGKHILTFKFNDKEESLQEIDKYISVVPRAPIINPPEDIVDNTITLTGTALVNSEVALFISGEGKSQSATVDVGQEGTWEYVIEMELEEGIYTVIAVDSKNGFGSTYSEPIIFEYTNGSQVIETVVTDKSGFNFTFNKQTIQSFFDEVARSRDLALYTFGLVAAGMIVGMIVSKLAQAYSLRKTNSFFKSIFDARSKKSVGEDESEKKMTLREKFEKAGVKEVSNPVPLRSVGQGNSSVKESKDSTVQASDPASQNFAEQGDSSVQDKEGNLGSSVKIDKEAESDKKSDEKNETEKVISKEEFLKEFKDADPDIEEKPKNTKTKKKAKPSKLKDQIANEPSNQESNEPSIQEFKSNKTDKKPASTKTDKNEVPGEQESRNIKITLTSGD